MNNSQSKIYADAGVDITAGYKSVELMKEHIAKTKTEGSMDDVGGFGGCFSLNINGIKEPVLVSGTDGVGTKIKLAMILNKHDTIGIDCVAMCVNDIICCGAKPLFFLDYIACGKNYPEKIAEIVSGVAKGCVMAGCALIGGETAEHPGLMPKEDYDLAGYSTGIVDKEKMLNKNCVEEGDTVIALASSGVHSNGFSLVRKVFNIKDENKNLKAELNEPLKELNGQTLGETLLTPTKIYVKPMLKLFEEIQVKAVSHITGGGFYENIPRALPKGYSVKVNKSAIKIPPIFKLIQEKGNVLERDMFNTFNMGVGMSVTVAKEDAEKALEILKSNGEEAYIIGTVIKSDEGVIIE